MAIGRHDEDGCEYDSPLALRHAVSVAFLDMARDAKRKNVGHSICSACVRDVAGRVVYAATLTFTDTWPIADGTLPPGT
ncbi:hypothetical protein MPLA_2000001 [Mesorhizobium sp. ORS 3359]|nr:hypothetical protein MPLA_2000001 [Mesorhizobium sp. ORS 3359]